MTETARDWLPVGVVSREIVRTNLADTISDWSAHWFAKRSFRAARFIEKAPGAPSIVESDGWLAYCGEVSVRVSRSAATRLLEAALDAGLSEASWSDADAALLEAFSDKIIRDLAARIEAGLGGGADRKDDPEQRRDSFGKDGGLEVTLADGQGPDLLSVAIPLRALLPLSRKSLPARAKRPSLQSLRRALGPTPLTVEVVIGEAIVGMCDLGSLAPGDVVVLGTALDQFAEINLSGSRQAFARARLTEIDGEMALALHARH